MDFVQTWCRWQQAQDDSRSSCVRQPKSRFLFATCVFLGIEGKETERAGRRRKRDYAMRGGWGRRSFQNGHRGQRARREGLGAADGIRCNWIEQYLTVYLQRSRHELRRQLGSPQPLHHLRHWYWCSSQQTSCCWCRRHGYGYRQEG